MLNQYNQTSTDETLLAQNIAQAFHDSDRLYKYVICCRKYPKAAIERAFKDAQSIPRDRIKKSRAAIFFYFVKRYANKSSQHSGH